MNIIKLGEYGYEQAALGFSLSYNSTPERAKEILPRYAFAKSGERKFLESIYVWLLVTAPRSFWQEADTYRISTKQSESTMHTLHRKNFTQENFEYPIPDEMLKIINDIRDKYSRKEVGIEIFKNCLPEGFLQTREWCFNYKTLQNIYEQRKNHRLSQWRYFCDELLKIIDHPEFIKQEF